jgi:HlyD family secretion protein
MKKTYWIILIILIVILGAGAWFLFGKKTEAALEWRSSKVEKGDIKVVVTASGIVSADTTVQVGTQVSGIISKIYVDFNSIVRKGQVVAVLDTTYLAAAVEDASASLYRNQVQVDLTKRNFDRTKEMFEQKVVAQVDYDQALSDYETAKANLRSGKSALNRALINLRYATIVAPVSGVVVSRNVDVGQTVAASFSTPTLFSIANDLTKMQVQASIDEADIGKVKVGQEVTFTVDAYDDQVFDGTVRQIRLQPTVTQNVVKYTVIITVPNPDLKLMPGMTANITIKIQEVKDVLKVAASALRYWPPTDYLEKNLKTMPDSIQKFIERMIEFRKRSSGQGSGSSMTGGGGFQGMGGSAMGSSGGGQGGSQRVERPRSSGGMMGNGRPGSGGGQGKYKRGLLWLKQGDNLIPVRVRTGITDGSVTEIIGNLKEGDEIVTGTVTSTANKTQTQQNPFAPQMPGGRGGR